LLASSKRPNGSGLRQSSTVPDAAEPLKVLEKLLGPEGKGLADPSNAAANGTGSIADDSDLELDFGGLSLRELAANASPKEEEAPQTIGECMHKPI
jgi:hypothetical protein